MNKLELTFPQQLTSFDPGAEIAITAAWDLDAPPDRIEARLVWHTSGRGDRDLKVVKTVTIESPSEKDQQLVTFSLPWGPYSFSGKLISLIWGIEIVSFPDEDSTRQEITVAPQGREVVLKGT